MPDSPVKGVAWDHRRCWGPLDADANSLARSGGLTVNWERRSLFSFGEGDLEPFCDAADMVIFDHPFTGDVARRGLMHDLTEWLTPDDIAVFERNAVGGSFDSYKFEGGIYGLPVDAAATTAAWRADLLADMGQKVPVTFEEVLALGAEARRHDKWIAWPAKPTDLMCGYIAMAVSLGHEPGSGDGPFVPRDLSEDLIARLVALRKVIHPESVGWNPIRLFDHMTSADDVLYTPYAFNYVNYASHPTRPLSFGAPPRHGAGPGRGLLGGAGIGISTRSGDPKRAFDYAMRLVAPEFQAGPYVANGGQPGMRAAWQSEDCDRMTNGFFSSCLKAMDDAFLRPNLPGFVPFFHDATERLAAVVNDGASHDDYWNWQTETHDALRDKRKVAAR
ncbi:extracellular solute-binding protein [Oceaniglobus trochenteri]|uniref:extracellular solute-binding protein n=1 Tax=Oceaniglobus trochenteri TaxID=2763260 RepID=UPI001CFF591B|nr:extracellular solute-binding protein [Oceaniglobus trochenteri]